MLTINEYYFKVSRQRWRVGGWLPPEKIKSRHFAILKKNIDCMVLKLIVYIRNIISFCYNPPPPQKNR